MTCGVAGSRWQWRQSNDCERVRGEFCQARRRYRGWGLLVWVMSSSSLAR
jgi:hypothetical protein